MLGLLTNEKKEVVDWWVKSGTLPQSKVKYLIIVIMKKVIFKLLRGLMIFFLIRGYSIKNWEENRLI
jgi:hypothetical protein